MSKLLQRADFVAQREEFDEMYEVNWRSQGNDFVLYCQLQDNPSWQNREKYQNAKFKKFYHEILSQLKSFAQNKDGLSESGSDIDNEGINLWQNYQFKDIQKLIDRLNFSNEISDSLNNDIWEISKKLGLSLKHDILHQKKQNISEKTDRIFAEKYKRVKEFKNEVDKSEKNIHINYKYVDKSIIPQLKDLSSEYKTQQKKYKRMKKILAEYNDTLTKLNNRMNNIENQVMQRMSHNMSDSQNIDVQKYQDFRHENNDKLRLTELQNLHKNECENYNQIVNQVNKIDQKITILQSYKEENELELRQSVDGLKYELRVVREELKTLEREKYSIANKLKSIEDKYNEAKESFKNAEQVLTYTNRIILNNSKSRISADSEFMRYSNGRESWLHTDSNYRVDTENSLGVMRNTNSRLGLDFYNAEPLVEEISECEADISSNYINDR